MPTRGRSTSIRVQITTLGILTSCAVPPAWADPQGLSTFVPVQIQDALTISRGTVELQEYNLYTRNTHNSAGPDLLTVEPTLKLGPIRDLQLDISTPYNAGNQTTADQGNNTFDFIYTFVDPTPDRPALGVQLGDQAVNYGAGHKSGNYFLRGLLTQYLGDGSASAPRLHLNINWTHFPQPDATGRPDQLEYGAALSMLVTPRVALVPDIVHGETTVKRQDETILDLGARWEINDDWALSGSAGVGFDSESPQFRVLFAFQRDFHLF